MGKRYKVIWDNGHACGSLPQEFETEEAAESYGRDWQIEMVAATPGATDDDYQFEVVETTMRYPEHEKMKAVKPQSQAIGEFILWAQEQGLLLCKAGERGWWPTHESIEQILARHFDIDLGKIEAEKQHMLEEIRQAQRER